MISRADALRICETNFPNGPEALVLALNVQVVNSKMHGVEGWCLRGLKTIVRINSASHQTRQRFTLAHELAHLIIGSKTDILIEPFRSDAEEEKAADRFAAEMLLPDSQLERYLGNDLPIDGRSLSRLAKAANVSQVMAALRVINAYGPLDSKPAAVLFFRDFEFEWRYGRNLNITDENALTLLRMAIKCKPELVRIDLSNGDHAIATFLETNRTQTLFVQVLPTQVALSKSYEERLEELARTAFGSDNTLITSLRTTMGQFRSQNKDLTLDQVVSNFFGKYVGRKYLGHQEQVLRSEAGKEYVRSFFSRYFRSPR